jgi:hypothetical protein
MHSVFVRKEDTRRTVKMGLTVGARLGVTYNQSFSPKAGGEA